MIRNREKWNKRGTNEPNNIIRSFFKTVVDFIFIYDNMNFRKIEAHIIKKEKRIPERSLRNVRHG